MQLTLHSDYGLRVLLYLAHFPERKVNTEEISAAFGISRHHLVQVVGRLTKGGFVKATPGRGGGIALAQTPGAITLGEVVRHCETNLKLVECFDAESNTCPIVPVCGLKFPLRSALEAFLKTLDGYTLADAVRPQTSEIFASFLMPR